MSSESKASNPELESEPKSDSLPFEPASNKKKVPQKPIQSAVSDRSSGIPEVVSQRMVRRMAFFSGVPSFLGMSTFVVSYLLVSQLHYALPNSAVLLVSLGFFGLGVVGLSYGILSASWEPEQSGSLLGIDQFSVNLSRTTNAWKDARRSQLKKNKDS